MTTVNALNSTPAAATQAASSKNAELGKDQFLKLFVAQLQHQDPMNPMQDSDFMGQMASLTRLSTPARSRRSRPSTASPA
jgi:flagellar basal-body rod modification protein FlgD